ncbi:hypothetical protein RB195_000328 [Necator americanus]|uniref:Uncharacterized protein n=1 Tax=Necator americanus TaxID=51031 RepID=A0ABR1DAT0_NECAM
MPNPYPLLFLCFRKFRCQQTMKHTGLVVTDTQLDEVVIRNYVLEFISSREIEGECCHALTQVGEAAFRFEGSGAFDEAYIKNQSYKRRANHRPRRCERPLSFGDTIEWYDLDIANRMISRFHRAPPLFTNRIYDGRSQVLVVGVVSPSNRFHFWSPYFPNIQIDSVSASEVLPNVPVSAWLNIAIDADRKLCIEFDSFEQVECETNIVANAPWNRTQSKYLTVPILDSDDGVENQIVEPETINRKGGWKQELHNYEGICTGERLIYCRKLPSYEIVVALIKNRKDCVPLETGVSCEFSAVWNEYEKRFIVQHYKTKGRVLRLGANGLVKTSVKAIEDYPSVFNSDDLGLIDDPSGILSLLHFSPYRHSSVVVTLHDSPSLTTRFRFRIVDVQPDKAPKLKKFVEENEIRVDDGEGIVIDAFTIYSKDHGSVFFYVPDNLRTALSPGKAVKFSARYQRQDEKFVVTHVFARAHEVPSVERQLLRLPYEQQRLFRVSAKKCRRKELDCLLENEEFGLLDVGRHTYLTKNNSQRTVWVMRSIPDVDETFRPSRTPFVVVWVGDHEPPCKNTEEIQPDVEQAGDQSTLEKISVINAEDALTAAMERMGVLTERKPHDVECTDEDCVPGCPIMEMIMLTIETVPQFLETLSQENPAVFTKIVNKMFK